MIDPITAMAAVSSAVTLIKKAAATVDDVASLGPLLGKYFDAKQTAVKAVKEAKKQKGSNMAQAIEIELALKAQKDFEEQIKGLFFSSNNMDIWNNIQARVAQMNAEDRAEEARERDRAKKAARRQAEINELLIAGTLLTIIIITVTYFLAKIVLLCKNGGCLS